MKTAYLKPIDRPTAAADVPMQPASWDIWDKKVPPQGQGWANDR